MKFVFKEDVIPAGADKILFVIAPTISVFTTMLAFSVVPFGPAPPTGAADFRSGSPPTSISGSSSSLPSRAWLFTAIILGGWSSNNKYSALGSLRSSAQVVSYEVPLGLSVLGVGLLAGSFNLEHVIGRRRSTRACAACSTGTSGASRWPA